MKEINKLQKGLGYQSIKLNLIPVTNIIENNELVYSKDKTEKLIKRLKERNDHLSCENRRLKMRMASFKYYEKIMEENYITSPHDLTVHFRGEKTWLQKRKEEELNKLKEKNGNNKTV